MPVTSSHHSTVEVAEPPLSHLTSGWRAIGAASKSRRGAAAEPERQASQVFVASAGLTQQRLWLDRGGALWWHACMLSREQNADPPVHVSAGLMNEAFLPAECMGLSELVATVPISKPRLDQVGIIISRTRMY
jgi:hypothetical protein